MIVTVKGGTTSQKKHIKSLVEFCAEKLIPRVHNLDIRVHLKDLSKSDAYGFCSSDPDGDAERQDRPRVFEIEIHRNMRLRKILETLCHEMVHVKQYARGELYQSSRTAKHRWQGRWVSDNQDYWDHPWEIEAHGRECGLFIRWAEQNKLGHMKWTQDA